MPKVLKEKMFAAIPPIDDSTLDYTLDVALKAFNRKIIVLDDDPTGVRNVQDISVFTQWTQESIDAGFAESNSMFVISTKSRAFSEDRVRREYESIAERIVRASKKFNRKFAVISRSDLTLRGHYPLETEVLRETLEREGYPIDGEVLMPFSKEGGRFTINDVNFVEDGDWLVPTDETDFSISISIEDLRAFKVDEIAARLEKVTGFDKVIVNAVDYVDVKVFVFALVKAMMEGKNFLFRSASALPEVIGNVGEQPQLEGEEQIDDETSIAKGEPA